MDGSTDPLVVICQSPVATSVMLRHLVKFQPSSHYFSNNHHLHQFLRSFDIPLRTFPQNYVSSETQLSEKTAPSTDLSSCPFYESTYQLNHDQADKVDSYTLVRMIRDCTNQGYVYAGRNLHSYALVTGLASNLFVSSVLVAFYVKLDSVNTAQKLFDEMPERNAVIWNTMISGCVQSGQFLEGLILFLQLDKSENTADAYSFSAALSACGRLSLLRLGYSIHSRIMRCGCDESVIVANSLIDMYGKCGSVEDAVEVFVGLNEYKDIISWNSIIAACARNRKLELALEYFYQMPNPDIISYNELISGVAQFGAMGDAFEILTMVPSPNSSSWNSILTGYVNRNRAQEALKIFADMHANGATMDAYTFSSILSGVARLAALTWGLMIHCFTVKVGLDTTSVIVGSALIDMYSKCGQVNKAEMLFRLLPNKNIVTWNAMISGFAHNGEPNKVIEHFERMKSVDNLIPDEITFLNVLAVCSHSQVPMEAAYGYFQSMVQDYGIVPTVEQITSMIRLLGQHGEVWRAEKMIYELGFGTCGAVWRALLGACRTCGDLEVAEAAAAKVIELEGDHEFPYVILANINASYGKWIDVNTIRELMRKKGVAKEPGSSWIEVDIVRTWW